MNYFEFNSPTKIYFGKDVELKVGEVIKEKGYRKVLLHYGKSSIIKNGLYEKIINSLKANDIEYVELAGVEANPKIELVREGVAIAKKENVDLILAVGGGSVIDSSKLIGVASKTDVDPWKFSLHEESVKDTIDLMVVLTISAAGSELSNSCVISNSSFNLKRGFNSDLIRPKFAFLNPELTYSVSKFQTACGIVDILMHTLERYLVLEDEAHLTFRLSEGLMKTVLSEGLKVMENPNDYTARANLMLASSLSHNGLTGMGVKWFFTVHKLEHELSGFYDEVAHAAGLSILYLAWARYVVEKFPTKFAMFARNVLNIPNSNNDYQDALNGIDALEEYFKKINMPTKMVDLGLSNVKFEEMADSATKYGANKILGIFDLTREDVLTIYKNSYK